MPKRYSSLELIKIIEKNGWYLVGIHGDHHKFKHNSKIGIVIVPHPRKITPVGTANSILKQAGLK